MSESWKCDDWKHDLLNATLAGCPTCAERKRIPEEVKDLLWDDREKGPYYVEHNRALIEAFNRGRRFRERE